MKVLMGLKTEFVKHESSTYWIQLRTRWGWVLEELNGVSLAASSLIPNTHRTTASCNICLCSSISEESGYVEEFLDEAWYRLFSLSSAAYYKNPW